MKILMINGSPNNDGCIVRAFKEMTSIFDKEDDVEYEIVNVGCKDIRGCIACRTCKKTGKCVFDDLVNETAPKFEKADAIVVGSPVYYASANGTLISFLDRLFFSTNFSKKFKVGASVVSARRAGNTATYDELNKYFGICQMPIASSAYWNMVHGNTKEEVEQDKEGLATMRILARNIVFLARGIQLAKEKGLEPEQELNYEHTNFIR